MHSDANQGRALRVAIFYRDFLVAGGIPRETELLARSMRKYVEELTVYCYTVRRALDSISPPAGLNVRTFDRPSLFWNRDPLGAPRGLKRLFLENRDGLSALVIMGSFIPENAPIGALARRARLPYVISPGDAFNPNLFGGLKGLKKGLFESIFERRLLNGASAVRLYSDTQAEHLTRRGYKDQGRFFIAKEGVDWETIRNDGLGSLAASPDPSEPRFGYLGRIDVFQKGLDVLLHAWKSFKLQGGPGVLRIAGPASSDQMETLQRMRTELDLQEVHLLGPLVGKEKLTFLESLWTLVHPSRHDGIPRVIREAFAVGCPAIVTDNTNLHDVVQEHGAGLVCRLEASHLASRMLVVATNGAGLRRMRAGARSAADALDWDEIGRKVVNEIALRL